MVCRDLGAGRGRSLVGGDDGRRLPLYFLVEDVLGLRLRQGVPVRYGLNRWVVPARRPSGRADAWRLGRLADVLEIPPHRGGLGNEGDDAHVGVAVRADQGQGLEQACEQHGPQVVRRAAVTGCRGSGR